MKENRRDKVFLPPPVDAYKGKEPYIFVSYSHQDKIQVYPEILRLHYLGYRIWYDEGIEPGDKISSEVVKAIKNCYIFIVFISQNAAKSEYVKDEIIFALKKKIKILPIYIEDTGVPDEIEFKMGDIHGIMKFKMIGEIYNKTLERSLPNEVLEDYESNNQKTKENGFAEETERPLFLPEDLHEDYKYDVFITFNNLDEEGDPTHDSILARKIFKFLSGKDLNVFHIIISIEKMGAKESESAIEEALNSSQIMVVVGMSPQNINSEKVKYEWSRFNEFINNGSKSDRLLITYFKGFDSLELPDTLRKNEVILDGPESLDSLYRLITKKLGIEVKKPIIEDLEWKELIDKRHVISLNRISGEGPDEITISIGDIIRVGRSNDNDIILNMRQVSRYHAEITFSKEGLFVEDLNSENGTFVNGKKISWRELKLGDVLKFDAVSYKVLLSTNDKGKVKMD